MNNRHGLVLPGAALQQVTSEIRALAEQDGVSAEKIAIGWDGGQFWLQVFLDGVQHVVEFTDMRDRFSYYELWFHVPETLKTSSYWNEESLTGRTR